MVSTCGRKVRALLAGGLVLGVGAAVTLSAWTDQEWAIGEFGAGSFNVQGSTDGTTFADHETSGGAAALTFDLATEADNMSPGTVVAAPFVLRLDAANEDVIVEAVGSGERLTSGADPVAPAPGRDGVHDVMGPLARTGVSMPLQLVLIAVGLLLAGVALFRSGRGRPAAGT